MASIWSSRLEVEIEPWIVLELQAPLLTVAKAANNDERSHETDGFKVIPQLVGVPDLPVLGFEGFSAAGLGIDFRQTLAASGFGGIGHLASPWLGCGDAQKVYN
jgi:hypothetical protein